MVVRLPVGAFALLSALGSGATLDPACDTALLEEGFATLTAIEAIAEVPGDRLRRPRPTPVRAEGVIADVPEDDGRR